MKLRNTLLALTACAVIGTFAGCNKSDTAPGTDTSGTAAPAPGSKGPMQQMVFDRTCNLASGLLAQKDYKGAREAIAQTDGHTLTPEQQARIDSLKAQIPAGK